MSDYQVPNPPCPLCHAQTALRKGKFGDFYGCTMWKETGCKGAVRTQAQEQQRNEMPAQPGYTQQQAGGTQPGNPSPLERIRCASLIAAGACQSPNAGGIDEIAYTSRMIADAIIRDCTANPYQ